MLIDDQIAQFLRKADAYEAAMLLLASGRLMRAVDVLSGDQECGEAVDLLPLGDDVLSGVRLGGGGMDSELVEELPDGAGEAWRKPSALSTR